MPAAEGSLAERLRAKLLDKQLPLPQRFRVLFSLRGLAGKEAADALLDGLDDPSALFRHEIAFALGQMQTPHAIAALAAKLRDASEHSMVRHEAAEALGAINQPGCEEILEEFQNDASLEVAQTCQLALGRIRYWRAHRATEAAAAAAAAGPAGDAPAAAPAGEPKGSKKEQFSHAFAAGDDAAAARAGEESPSPFLSVDPVPPADDSVPLDALAEMLRSEDTGMFDRYRAMFALRNRGTAGLVPMLGEVLLSSKSALLQHEICYVLGQIQDKSSLEVLEEILQDPTRHAMVRHEAAEAIGSIAGEESKPLLEQFTKCEDRVVGEGCEVALDIMAYELSGDFEYCDVSDK